MAWRTLRLAAGSAIVAALSLAVCVPGPGLVRSQELSIKVLVNDDPISDYDISQRTRFLAVTSQQQPNDELRKKATDSLIDERLQMQEGQKLGYTADEEDVNKIVTDMAEKNNLDAQGLATALGRAGVNIKTLKDRIRAQLVWQYVVTRKFRHTVQIGDVDIDRALEESGESGGGGGGETQLQLQQVKFSLPSNADQKTIAAKLAAAESLRSKFGNCANVADLAKSTSGASIKTLQDAQTSSLAQPARLLVQNANIGQMTPPTISPSGVELYAVCGKVSGGGDLKVREDTQRKLMNEELMIHAERLIRDLRQDAFIEYR